MAVSVVNAERSSNWIIVLLEDDAGNIGLGEGGVNGFEEQVLYSLKVLWASLRGQDVLPLDGRVPCSPGHPLGLAFATAASAIDQALWDLHARSMGEPVVNVLGGAHRRAVPLYANINRSLRGDRSPEAFAATAAAAVADGFDTIKCAPFDGLHPNAIERKAYRALLDTAYRRVGAVRDAVGPTTSVLIDCHWRFDARSASIVLKELEQFNPAWVEAPVSEHALEDWQRVRDHTTLRLAGGEMLVGLAAFERFIRMSQVDVIMPDVRYCGGVGMFSKIASFAQARNVEVSPHNPAGPVATMVSAHIVAARHSETILEFPFGETPWRGELTSPAEPVRDGSLVLGHGAGWGITLNDLVASGHPYGSTNQTIDLSLL